MYAGEVEVEVGPLNDFAQLTGFEDAAAGIDGASEITVKRFSGGRATVSMNLEDPVDLLRELEERAPFDFVVRDTRRDGLILDVDEDGAASRTARRSAIRRASRHTFLTLRAASRRDGRANIRSVLNPNLQGQHRRDGDRAGGDASSGSRSSSRSRSMSRYDLVFGISGRLSPRAVQVGARWTGEVLSASTSSAAGTQPKATSRNKYTADEVDAVAAYCHELGRTISLPFDRVEHGKSGIHLRLDAAQEWPESGDTLRSRIRTPWGYSSVGRASAWHAEVAGSSPASSTLLIRRVAKIIVGAHRVPQAASATGWSAPPPATRS